MRADCTFRGAGLAVVLLGASARAAAPTVNGGGGPTEDVTFRADRLELDPALARLRLSGHVSIGADRYRLTSERLEVVRRPHELLVKGPGELAFCPCPSPPLTLRFEAARLLPPSDVILEQPTARLFGVPVLWLPYLWFRTPERWGLLPFVLAYRGDDGFLLGSGVHLPFGETHVDLSAAGYVRGGVELGARVSTARSESVVRWDYLQESALAVDLRGSSVVSPLASLAWNVDALRGPRALGGPSMLEAVSLRQDRASGGAGWSDGAGTFGVAVMASSPRGRAVPTVAAAGPSLYAGFDRALGSSATAHLDVGVTTLGRRDAGALSLFTGRAAASADARAGFVAFHVDARGRATATLDEEQAGHAAVSTVGVEASAPFVGELGSTPGALQHWISPVAQAEVGVADARAPSVVPAVAADGAFYVATAGLKTVLGQTVAERAAVSLSARGGVSGDRGESARAILAFRAVGRARALAVRADEISVVAGPDRSDLALSTVRLGSEDALFVEGRAEGMRGTPPTMARLVLDGIDAPAFPWLSASGWSVGGRLGIPLGAWLNSTADAEYDVTARTLLGVRGAMTYRHPCGCLSATVWAGHRIGREGGGVDSFLTVSLSR